MDSASFHAGITSVPSGLSTPASESSEDSAVPVQFDVKKRDYRPTSTWHLKPLSKMNLWELIVSRDLGPPKVYERDSSKDPNAKAPYHNIMWENLFILPRAVAPVLLQRAWYELFPEWKWHPLVAFLWYWISLTIFSFALIDRLHYWMGHYGVLDHANRPRDRAPDKDVNRLGLAIMIYTIVRSGAPILAVYKSSEIPGFSVWTLPKMALWMISLDYWFYVYHRSCHQVPWLWNIHRKHHSTKHPTPVLAILADDFQEFLEILILPFLASCVVPLSYSEFYVTACYMIYVEAMGHAGIRARWGHPILDYILTPLGMELTIEDHDLHHRGGKSGQNFGKATRIFDRLFGSCDERIET